MAFSYQPVPQRIQDCVQKFDYHAAQGQCPTNWRSKIKLAEVRFGVDKLHDNFPAKVFGSWERAKSVGRFGWACTLKDLGVMASKDAGTAELRKLWEETLQTDTSWRDNCGILQKVIKGCLVSIYLDGESYYYRIEFKRSGQISKVGSAYSNLASAKRAVRKLTHLI